MSKHLLSLLLDELSTVRIVCKADQCGGVIEVPVDASPSMRKIECPRCKTVYRDASSNEDSLSSIARACRLLNDHRKEFDIEFVLPVKE